MKYNHLADEAIPVRLAWANNIMPCLAIVYDAGPKRGEGYPGTNGSQKTGATIEIDANGGDLGSKLEIILRVKNVLVPSGTATTDTTYTIDGTTYNTFYKIIEYINTLPGFKAWALNLPHSFATDVDTWADLAETRIPDSRMVRPLKCLYRNMASGASAYVRIGTPESHNAGKLRLMRVAGTTTGTTASGVRAYTDNYASYVAGATPNYFPAETANATGYTQYWNQDKDHAATYQGSLIVEVYASDLTAAEMNVVYANAEF